MSCRRPQDIIDGLSGHAEPFGDLPPFVPAGKQLLDEISFSKPGFGLICEGGILEVFNAFLKSLHAEQIHSGCFCSMVPTRHSFEDRGGTKKQGSNENAL